MVGSPRRVGPPAVNRNIEGVFRYLSAIAADYRFAGGHSGLGYVFLRAHLHDSAEKAFGNALDYDPYLGTAWTGLGIAAVQRGDDFGALFYFSTVVARNPSDEIAHCGLGDAHVNLGSEDLAELAYREAVLAAPFSTIALSRLSDLLDRTGGRAKPRSSARG